MGDNDLDFDLEEEGSVGYHRHQAAAVEIADVSLGKS